MKQYTTTIICKELKVKDYQIENLFRANKLSFSREGVWKGSGIRYYSKKQFEEIRKFLKKYSK